MKKGKFKSNFLFIVGISIVVLVLFSVGFATFYKDSSFVFDSDGYIINATENSSDSYSFASGTKYKTNLNKDISFEDTSSKSVSVDSASFVHYENGSISFLQNGALMDLDKVNEDYVPYYNISNKFMINYDNGKYNITNDTKSLEFTNWIGRISDDKYIVVGDNLSLKIPGVNKTIEGDYFELLFMTDGVVKIDNQDVSYQVTAQGSTVYVGDNIKIDLGENTIYHNNEEKMLLSQITISGDENIDLENGGNGGSGGGGTGDGEGSGVASSTVTSGITTGVITSGVTSGTTSGITSGITSGTADGDGEGSGSGGSGEGSGGGEGEGDGTGEGGSGEGSGEGVNTTTSASIELIKLDVTATSMYATLQMNRSNLISGSLVAYLTNISTGERVSVDIKKQDGTLYVCSTGTDCYTFRTSMIPDSQYLLSIVDVNSNNQYFQKLINTSELGVTLEKLYTTSSSLTYNVNFSTNTSVEQLDLYLYDADGVEKFKQVGINETTEVVFRNLKSYSSYNAVIKNVSVCDEDGNCSFDDKYEISRTDLTLKMTPVIEDIAVTKNVDSATFDLSAKISDQHETVTKYVYTVCNVLSVEEQEEGIEPECFSKEKTDGDALNIKVGTDVQPGVMYNYTFKVQYNDGQMEREVISNQSRQFSMEVAPYFQLSNVEATSNSIKGKLSLVDPSCTVPIEGRTCRNGVNSFTLSYYRLVDGEEKKVDIEIGRDKINIDEESGLYYFDFNLTNLASETKYVIKVFGKYFLNGQEFTQIGDELYVETISTGNLKFIYTDNVSSGDNVVNYNARLSGGSDIEGEDATEQEALSALNTIYKLNFDLYYGNYADNSEDNNRYIGNVSFTGNSKIKQLFCNTDSSSNVCNTSHTFTNAQFSYVNGDEDIYLSTLSDLMKSVADRKYCSNKVKGCLGTSYTIVVSGFDKAGNAINIDNSTYTYNVTPSYYVTTMLQLNNKVGISLEPFYKEDYFNDPFGYRSETLDAANEILEEDTVVGINVKTEIPVEYINAVYSYDKIERTYYFCDVLNETVDDCKENAEFSTNTVTLNLNDNGGSYYNSNHKFYVSDGLLSRGRSYKFMYELVFTNSNGVQTYSSEYTIDAFNLYKQAPVYDFYIKSSSKNTITYGYNIKDVDGAIFENDYNFYYKVGESKAVEKGDSFTLDIPNDNVQREVTFQLCEDVCNATDYQIYLNEQLLGEKPTYVPIVKTVFDGDYNASENDEFELFTYSSDNRLFIKLNDYELGDRTALYHVKLSNGSEIIYDKYYLASKLESCTVDSEEEQNDAIICQEEPGDYRYITVDYANKDVAVNMGKNISVTVDSYYDSGLVGFRQTFTNGLVLQNLVKNKYLNIYGSSKGGTKTVIESEDDTTNGIYMIDGNTTFGNESVTLYHYLGIGNINSYSNSTGVSLFEDSPSLINKEYKITYLSDGIKLGDYSGYDPKVVRISTLKYENNNFKFDSIIPKVRAVESRGINSLGINFIFSSVTTDDLSTQFKKQDGKYYLYVNLYKEDGTVIEKNKKVEINLDGSTSTLFTNLDVKTNYKYDIWADLKDGNGYTRVQLYDGSYIEYVKTVYETSTLSEGELLSKVVFKANPVAYKNDGESISDKTISYNVKVTNGSYLKIRLGLYNKKGELINFDGTSCINEVNCYVEISDASHSIPSMSNVLKEYNFNNNDYVFGNDYYALKVFAIPYYSNSKSYDTSKMLTLYDSVLVTKNQVNEEIDVSELEQSDFNVSDFKSGYNVNDGYFVSFTVSSVSDSDFVMKNGEYYITLYDSSGNVVYVVKHQQNKTVMVDGNNKVVGDPLSSEKLLLYNNKNVSIKFPNLNNNTQYSIELSYVTYRNNVSFGSDEAKKKAVSPYTDYIYTPINEGITLGNVVISRESKTTFKLDYIGSNNLSKIKRVDYKVNLRGSTYSTSGYVSGNSIFTKSGDNYSLNIDLMNSENSSFQFEFSGTYNVTITYYTDTAGKNKIYSSTFSILV